MSATATATATAKRGFILCRRTHPLPSAIVQKEDAIRMQRRFGGVLVPASGIRYRTVNGSRVVAAVDLPEVKRRFEAASA